MTMEFKVTTRGFSLHPGCDAQDVLKNLRKEIDGGTNQGRLRELNGPEVLRGLAERRAAWPGPEDGGEEQVHAGGLDGGYRQCPAGDLDVTDVDNALIPVAATRSSSTVGMLHLALPLQSLRRQLASHRMHSGGRRGARADLPAPVGALSLQPAVQDLFVAARAGPEFCAGVVEDRARCPERGVVFRVRASRCCHSARDISRRTSRAEQAFQNLQRCLPVCGRLAGVVFDKVMMEWRAGRQPSRA
jgi:hypothetical protein